MGSHYGLACQWLSLDKPESNKETSALIPGLSSIARLNKLRKEVWRQMFYQGILNFEACDLLLNGSPLLTKEFLKQKK